MSRESSRWIWKVGSLFSGWPSSLVSSWLPKSIQHRSEHQRSLSITRMTVALAWEATNARNSAICSLSCSISACSKQKQHAASRSEISWQCCLCHGISLQCKIFKPQELQWTNYCTPQKNMCAWWLCQRLIDSRTFWDPSRCLMSRADESEKLAPYSLVGLPL